jgi:hypothetical protein
MFNGTHTVPVWRPACQTQAPISETAPRLGANLPGSSLATFSRPLLVGLEAGGRPPFRVVFDAVRRVGHHWMRLHAGEHLGNVTLTR